MVAEHVLHKAPWWLYCSETRQRQLPLLRIWMYSLTMQIAAYDHIALCFAWCKTSFHHQVGCFPVLLLLLLKAQQVFTWDMIWLLCGWVKDQHLWLTSIFGNVGLIHGPETVVKSKHLQGRQHRECKQTLIIPVQARTAQHNTTWYLLVSALTSSVVQKQAYSRPACAKSAGLCLSCE